MALRAKDSENPETNPTMLVASPEDMVEWKRSINMLLYLAKKH